MKKETGILENIDISLGNSWDIGILLFSYFKLFKNRKKQKRKEEQIYRKFEIRNKKPSQSSQLPERY
jgi:hypothetical protein